MLAEVRLELAEYLDRLVRPSLCQGDDLVIITLQAETEGPGDTYPAQRLCSQCYILKP